MDAMNSPIFVLSTGRCGTLALQRFLHHSNEVKAFHRYRGRASKYWNDMSFVLEQNYAYYNVVRNRAYKSNRARYLVWSLRRSREYLIRKVQQERKTFVELNHEFSPFGPLLAKAFPEAKFVHLVRDPKAVISSFMRKFDPPRMELPAFMGIRYSIVGQHVLRYGRIRALARIAPRSVREFVESYRFDTHLHPFERVNGKWREKHEMDAFEKTCWYWNEVNKIIREIFDLLPANKKLTTYFEEIFDTGSEHGKKAFLDFIGVRDLVVADMCEFFQQRQNMRDIHSSFPRQEEWDDRMIRVMHHYCRESMEELGYSQNDE